MHRQVNSNHLKPLLNELETYCLTMNMDGAGIQEMPLPLQTLCKNDLQMQFTSLVERSQQGAQLTRPS
jgi:hypothetical protein